MEEQKNQFLPYKIICEPGYGEYEEKKSRFLANAAPVTSEEEAAAFIASVRKKYYDARHHCYAFVIGRNREITRCSDDGEPGGTAGKPILETLLGTQAVDGIVVVTRYFGGTLLGTGGALLYAGGAGGACKCQNGGYALRDGADGSNRIRRCGSGAVSSGNAKNHNFRVQVHRQGGI